MSPKRSTNWCVWIWIKNRNKSTVIRAANSSRFIEIEIETGKQYQSCSESANDNETPISNWIDRRGCAIEVGRILNGETSELNLKSDWSIIFIAPNCSWYSVPVVALFRIARRAKSSSVCAVNNNSVENKNQSIILRERKRTRAGEPEREKEENSVSKCFILFDIFYFSVPYIVRSFASVWRIGRKEEEEEWRIRRAFLLRGTRN